MFLRLVPVAAAISMAIAPTLIAQRTITGSLGQECGLHRVATLRCARTADASTPAAVFSAGVVTVAALCQAAWSSSPSRLTQPRRNVFDLGSFVDTAVG
jgi:hypothetical protein